MIRRHLIAIVELTRYNRIVGTDDVDFIRRLFV